MTEGANPLREHLAGQLRALELADDLARLARHVLGYIDRTGYVGRRNDKDEFVPVPPAEIAAAFSPPTTPDRVEEALRVVQRLDPPGVGARHLRECLLLQLRPDTPHRDLVRGIIQDHLEDVAHGRLQAVGAGTAAAPEDIQEALWVVRHLDPRPGMRFPEAPAAGEPTGE